MSANNNIIPCSTAHSQLSIGVRSGDRSGHGIVPPRPIQLLGELPFKISHIYKFSKITVNFAIQYFWLKIWTYDPNIYKSTSLQIPLMSDENSHNPNNEVMVKNIT